MSRISLGHFLIAGLLFWGLPAYFVVGPQAVIYTILTVLPLWWFCRRDSSILPDPGGRISLRTCAVVSGFSLAYFIWDAVFGRRLLGFNMFLHGHAGVTQEVEQIAAGASQGGGIADLLGYILALLPLVLIDAANNTTRTGRWILWLTALVGVFYSAGAGRGDLMMVVLAIALGRSTDWRRILMAGGVALGIFFAASVFRGDLGSAPRNPLIDGIVAPYVNLTFMLNAGCGHAPWYSFIVEFLKKFLPAFLVPKSVFSFNVEMSWCINPENPNLTNGVSVFTWLSEIFYYTPSFLTAIVAGVILGILARAVNRRFVKRGLYSARLLAGLICFYLPRSRTQDVFTYFIAQLIFLAFFWPQLCNLLRNLRQLLPPPRPLTPVTRPNNGLAE